MPIMWLVIVLVVAGFGLYMLERVPIDPTMKLIIWALVILIVVILVIYFIAGLMGLSTNMPPLRVR